MVPRHGVFNIVCKMKWSLLKLERKGSRTFNKQGDAYFCLNLINYPSGFPGVIGCVDGTEIVISEPGKNAKVSFDINVHE